MVASDCLQGSKGPSAKALCLLGTKSTFKDSPHTVKSFGNLGILFLALLLCMCKMLFAAGLFPSTAK